METEEHVLTSASGEYSRKAWLFNSGSPRRMCILLDGEYYLERFDMPGVLRDLLERGLIEPVSCLFVTLENREARHHDYACNPRYARFIAEDCFRWMRERLPHLGGEDHLIAGLSLSGLAAAFIALTYPDRFSRALCQSGSFWWNHEWLADNLELSVDRKKSKFWVSAGTKETQTDLTHGPTGLYQGVSQVAACERFAQALTARQHPVHYHLFEGGHEITPWKDELSPALAWLLTPAPPGN